MNFDLYPIKAEGALMPTPGGCVESKLWRSGVLLKIKRAIYVLFPSLDKGW